MTMTTTMNRLGVLCFAAVLAVTGCAAEEEPESPAVASGTAPSGQESKEAEAEPLDPATCLRGTWLADNENFLVQFKEIGGSELTSVTGEVTQTFDDSGGLTTVYDNWRIETTNEGMEVTIVREGTDRGTYTSDGSVVSIRETDVGSELVVTSAGLQQRVQADVSDFTDAPYTCDATTASIVTPDGNANLTRLN